MKMNALPVCALAFAVVLVAGCDPIEKLFGVGEKTKAEAERVQTPATPVDEASAAKRKADALRLAELEALAAFVRGKLSVFSNRVSEAKAAALAVKRDREAFSRAMGDAVSDGVKTGGVWLERALRSRELNALAMKYLKSDFSVSSAQFEESLTLARKNESEYEMTLARLGKEFEKQVEGDALGTLDAQTKKNLVNLDRERLDLEKKRYRLAQNPIPDGQHYRHQRINRERELREIERRLREVIHSIDRLNLDIRNRADVDFKARQKRKDALRERDSAESRLKKEFAAKPTVEKTVTQYVERTVSRLERALVRDSEKADERTKKANESLSLLKGLRDGMENLSREGLRKVREQVEKL